MKNLFSIKYLALSLLTLFVVNNKLSAYNGVVSFEIVLRKVSFKGSTPEPVSGHHTLISDDDAQTFSAPHYTNPKIVPGLPPPEPRRFPTAYTKGETPHVQMEFEVNIELEDGATAPQLLVKADEKTGMNLEKKPFNLVNGPQTLTYDWEPTKKNFPNQIRFYGPGIGKFEFEWKYSLDGKNWSKLHTSMHRIYLTDAKPTPNQGNRETLFYYACNQPDANPKKCTSGGAVTQLIWNDFIPKTMKKINHGSGYLYGLDLEFNPAGGVILKDGTGQCETWASFFRDVLSVHGYPSKKVEISSTGITLPNGLVSRSLTEWFVNVQTITSAGTITNGSVAAPTPPATIDKGQGDAQTTTAWAGHTIAQAFGKLYDASYGIGGFVNEAAYENSATPGFRYTGGDWFSDKDVECFVVRPSSPTVYYLKYKYIP